jgi:lipopolysaccharide export system permease protein
MRILDRYILKSVIGIFFWCLFVFFFLFIIVDLFSHLDVILENKVNLEVLLGYYLSYLPIVFVQVSAFACLLATLYTFAKLNHDNEIIAMRSSGLSIFQITRTVIIFGLISSVFIFWVNDKFVPSARLLNEKIKEQMESTSKKIKFKENQMIKDLAIYGLKNRLFFINAFYPANSTMEGIVILEHDPKQNITRKIWANGGSYVNKTWKFYQSTTYVFDENGQLTQEPQYLEEEIMSISETPQEFLNQQQSTDFMSLSQIQDYIVRFSKSGATTVVRNLKVDLFQRLTSPFISFIIILLGIPFALKIKKRATGLSSLGIALTVGFLYYVLNAVSIALGKAGIFTPFMAAASSHLAVLLLSLSLIRGIP